MGLDDVGDHGGEMVVVAELDFVDGHGVVLVDDRDDPPFQQGEEGVADVQKTLPVGDIAHRQEDLADEEAVLPEGVGVNPHQTALADRRGRLLLGDALELPGDPQPVFSRGDGAGTDQDDLVVPLPEGRDVVDELFDDLEVKTVLSRQDGASDLDEDLPDIGEHLFSCHDAILLRRIHPASFSRRGEMRGDQGDELPEHFRDAFPGRGRKGEYFYPFSCKGVNFLFHSLPGGGEVELADRHDLPFFQHVGAEELQFPVDRFVVMPGALIGFLRDIDDMEQDGGPLDVAEELHAHPQSFVRPLDQSRDVGDHERFLIPVLDDAQMGDERREGIIGDLGTGGRHPGDERRFADVRQTDDPHIGQEFELQRDPPFLARDAGLGEAGGLTRGGGESRVSPAAHAALGDDEDGAVGGQIGEEFPVSASRMTVPTGTTISTSSESLPVRLLPSP